MGGDLNLMPRWAKFGMEFAYGLRRPGRNALFLFFFVKSKG